MTADEPFAKPPRLPAVSAPTDDLGDDIEAIDGWVELDGVSLDGRSIAVPDVEVIELTNCSLRSCRLITSPDTIVRARRTDFASCDLSQVQFKVAQGCRFTSAKMAGTSFVGELADCEFVDCRFQLASLVMSSISRVRFGDCELVDVDLQESKLSDVTFAGTRLAEVSLHRATFDRVDLRDASIESVSNVTSLDGCLVANHQLYELAPVLANLLGLTVDT